jgi:acetyltransferase-like isoleucine patch superfamily enzyme
VTVSERRRADPDPDRRRHRRVTDHRTPPGENSLWRWPAARHPLRVAVQYLAVWLVRLSPSLRLKNWLLRRLGVTVGEGVAWGLEATPDVFWPDRITLGPRAVVGYDATILCHEFLDDRYRVGEVVVGADAMVGAGAVVLPGVHVGAGASVAANSLVTEDVPPGATVAGVPARPMSDEDGAVATGGAAGGPGHASDPPGADDPADDPGAGPTAADGGGNRR